MLVYAQLHSFTSKPLTAIFIAYTYYLYEYICIGVPTARVGILTYCKRRNRWKRIIIL